MGVNTFSMGVNKLSYPSQLTADFIFRKSITISPVIRTPADFSNLCLQQSLFCTVQKFWPSSNKGEQGAIQYSHVDSILKWLQSCQFFTPGTISMCSDSSLNAFLFYSTGILMSYLLNYLSSQTEIARKAGAVSYFLFQFLCLEQRRCSIVY